MTVKEVIDILSKYPENAKVFSLNEDDCMWSEGVVINYEKDFNGVTISDTGSGKGYWYSPREERWIWID